jgi:glycosyltransferase involved in cell wall biosynthesis
LNEFKPYLSVLMPALNEGRTLDKVIDAVLRVDLPLEIVLVDDGSTDDTWAQMQARADGARVRAYRHTVNMGKGAAIRTALRHARGELVIIQDADLEYDPHDWEIMFDLIARRRVADAVFGSRFFGLPHRSLNFHHYLGNRLISLTFNILFNQTLSDVECCYKMFTREVRKSLNLTCLDFGVEIELSAQIAAAKRWRIYEVAVNYFGRTYQDGKKIMWTDGLKALWYVAKYRMRPGHVA